MEIIAIILSGLALFVATVNLIMTIREKKRNQKRNAATLQFMNSLEEGLKRRGTDWEAVSKELSAYDEKFKKFADKLDAVEKMAQDLSCGVVPDYEEAVRAKDAIDTLSRDIAEILGFDPLRAAKEARLQRRTNREVE